MEYIQVHLVNLPPRIHGLTAYKFDGGYAIYTILINAKLSSEMQCRTYDHEIAHINNHDFDAMYNIDEIEGIRHEETG